MNREEMTASVRALRGQGLTPKQIARALAVSPATVATLVRQIAADDYALVGERALAGCWVSPGWSDGLNVPGSQGWPDVASPRTYSAGLANVLVARDEGRGRVSACGYLVDVYCLGVKNVIGPKVIDGRLLAGFAERFFAAFNGESLVAPLELARQLVFGAVDYARGLGFEPHPEFDAVAGHLGSWDGQGVIGFGREGEPFYIEGPYDDTLHIMRTLARSRQQRDGRDFVSATPG